MPKNKIITYNPNLKLKARELRKNSTLSEILLWGEIKNKKLGYEFHRQVPIHEYIVDFFCHELLLVLEIDGDCHKNGDAVRNDLNRQNTLEQVGIKFIRFDDLDIKHDLDSSVRILLNKIEELRSELDNTSPLPPSKGE